MNTDLLSEFKVRVYGLLEQNGNYLVSHERYQGLDFCKFPGGGMDLGETPPDCLRREIQEELHVDILDLKQYYFAERLVQNRFRPSQQVMGLYYTFTVGPDALSVIQKELDTSFDQELLTHIKREWVSKERLLKRLSFEMDQEMAAFLLK